ncbi:Uncharacterized protein ToN1_29440 [Aromatoleum petrolei]|nr:Uncharacterized protein ToN1_29440 [Aromatoleum petrolei]
MVGLKAAIVAKNGIARQGQSPERPQGRYGGALSVRFRRLPRRLALLTSRS